MFNSTTTRCPRTGKRVRADKPQKSDVQWIIGFVVVGAILGALTSGVDLPFDDVASGASVANVD